MTDRVWKVGESRFGKIWPPIDPTHPGFHAECLLCPRPLGGVGEQALCLQELVIGPAHEDTEAIQRHEAGLPYRAAALVVHEECARTLRTQAEVEVFVAGVKMERERISGEAAS